MKLLASGCSYTDYYWSTWADIIGAEFTEYQQVGMGGGDNATIARSIVNTARANDIVVVMWSSYDRWSFYSETVIPLPKDPDNHWVHTGSLKTNKQFYVHFYNRVERFQTTMDYMQLVDLHSRSLGYEVYHFSAFPFFLGEIEKTIDTRFPEIYKRYNIKNNYTSEISLDEFKIQNYNLRVKGKNPLYGLHYDNHPTPLCHWDYAEQVMAPKLNIQLKQDRKENIIKEQQNLV